MKEKEKYEIITRRTTTNEDKEEKEKQRNERKINKRDREKWMKSKEKQNT